MSGMLRMKQAYPLAIVAAILARLIHEPMQNPTAKSHQRLWRITIRTPMTSMGLAWTRGARARADSME